MAIFIVENNGKISYGIKRYVCKTMADIPVEVNGEEIAPGSKVYVSDEKKTYMLNTAGQWVEIKEGGGASALSDLADVDISGSVQGGKVLKYNAVEEKWAPGDDSGNVQSDWNENDPTSGAFILNKPEIMPNYTIGTPTVLVDTTTVSFSKDGDNDWYISAENPITFTLSTSDIDASIFIIEWDGVEYKLFLKMVQEAKPTRGVTGNGYFDWLYIGNMDPLGYGSTITDISVPFAVTVDYMKNAGEKYLFSYDTSASHTIKISKASFTKTIVDYTLYGDSRYCGYPATRIASSKGSVAECGAAKSTGSYSHAEGVATIASGNYSHAEGGASIASGNFSHAEGLQVTASGNYSHAEGGGHVSTGFTTASAAYSHAEGYSNIASGAASHAEGAITTASGSYSHASGQRTIASGNTAHTCGTYTIAKNKDQVAFGQANIEDPSEAGADARGNYVEIVGNGTWEKVGNETIITRSNARTLDWSGNETLAGDLIINGNRSVANALNGIPTELSELSDVNIISTPEDGQVLSYDATSDKWVAGAPGSSGVELTQAEYDALTPEEKTNGTEYFITDGTNAPVEAASILYDNEDSGLLASDVQNAIDELNYNISNLSSDLEGLEDVNISNIQDGQIIKYNASTQTWVNADDEGGTELPVPTTADIGKSLVVESDGQGGTQYAYDINSCVELTQAAYDALTSEEKNNGSIYQISDKGYFYYKEKKFHQVKELTMAEYNQLTPAEQNNGVEYFITDAPEIVTEITLADYEELTLEEQMNGTIYQIIDCGYFFYKGNRFMASLELTLAEYNQLTLEEQMNGTEYFITDAPEMVTDLAQVEYDALTTEQKNNGSIYQISNKGYCYYKEKQFRATKELTQAQYDALTPEQKADGTIYMISDATNNLGDLDDVTLTSPADGNILTYDANSNEWVNGTVTLPSVSYNANTYVLTFDMGTVTANSNVESN